VFTRVTAEDTRLLSGSPVNAPIHLWHKKHPHDNQPCTTHWLCRKTFPGKRNYCSNKTHATARGNPSANTHKNGERKWITIWHDVIAWDKTADYAERNFVKGSKILVEGELTYRTYADQQGHTRYLTQITAKNLLNLDR
jgi:Single-strand binding protein family